MRRVHAPRPITLWHLVSLDAPTVAVLWSLSFAWAAGVHLHPWVPALLALVVWAVYVGDRLLDARAGLRTENLEGLRERHYFHWRHRRVLLPMAVAAAVSAVLLILVFMPALTRERDSLLAAASLVYFVRVHLGHRSRPFLSRVFTKELLVGVLFTLGCALPAAGMLWRGPHGSLRGTICAVVFFATLAWLNCHAIEAWESRSKRGRKISVFRRGRQLAAVGLVTAAFLVMTHPRPAALLLAGAFSALLLALLDRYQEHFDPVALRAAADLALLTPVLLLPLWRLAL